jgi:hypothetical protein
VNKLDKQICENCKKECVKHAKGMCTTCYKKLVWKPKLQKCRRCGKEKPNHAKGLCSGCYQSTFQLDKVKDFNYRKWYNISPEIYRNITNKCLICGFEPIVELHHLDKDHKNNSENNLIGLCPNHHKMLHSLKYRDEIKKKIEEKQQNN